MVNLWMLCVCTCGLVCGRWTCCYVHICGYVDGTICGLLYAFVIYQDYLRYWVNSEYWDGYKYVLNLQECRNLQQKKYSVTGLFAVCSTRQRGHVASNCLIWQFGKGFTVWQHTAKPRAHGK